ncbi:Multicopper oxidase lpr2 [Turnera subulata]|uniref:Multicopper oxidase lpr2 n=1 Tax=Turnera subulata TaxID=218843 RepID=A0A9Q0FQV0_9ROSI|nr:Multicopper oxidase lpr2 [Turnera subulata]
MEKKLFLHILCFALLWLLNSTMAQVQVINASSLAQFVDKLPDMPKIQAYGVVNGTFRPLSNPLKIGLYSKNWKFHRDIPPTPVFALGTCSQDATVPGPTIEAIHGIDTYIQWENHLPAQHILPWDPTIPTAIPKSKIGVPTVVHLHGGIDEVKSDGYGLAWFTNGFSETGPNWVQKVYHYHNLQQPGNCWYHDHTLGLTRVNLLAGMIGSYIIRQPEVEAPLRLPSGGEFDRVLFVFDRNFYTNGSLYMNPVGNNPSIHPQWSPEYFGDVIVVNGKAWPTLTVRRRKYRFRIINASNARFFNFFFTNGLPFVHVGSDSAYIDSPVSSDSLLLGPAEIADVVVDFSKSTTSTTILANDANYPYPTGNPVNQANGNVMKFIIKSQQEPDPSVIPATLIKYPVADPSIAAQTRYITLDEYTSSTGEPTHLYINGVPLSAPVTETPKVGTSEVWYVINLTGDNHPFHIHLALFKVLDQTALVNQTEFQACMNVTNDAVKCRLENYAVGGKLDVVAQEKGWKNVYKMQPGYVTKILVRFAYINSDKPYPFDATEEPGYVYHCHILDHEDNEMMRPLKPVA